MLWTKKHSNLNMNPNNKENELSGLKCGDCVKCVWVNFGQYWCDHTALPVKRDDPACISIELTRKARKRRECLTK